MVIRTLLLIEQNPEKLANITKFLQDPNFKISGFSSAELLVEIGTKYVPTRLTLDFRACHECLADFVITGNTTDLTFPTYNQTKIVTPAPLKWYTNIGTTVAPYNHLLFWLLLYRRLFVLQVDH